MYQFYVQNNLGNTEINEALKYILIILKQVWMNKLRHNTPKSCWLFLALTEPTEKLSLHLSQFLDQKCLVLWRHHKILVSKTTKQVPHTEGLHFEKEFQSFNK